MKNSAPWPWKVQYWKTSKGFGSVKTRKFRTAEAAWRFVDECHDRDCETWTFGPDCPTGSTWNGSSGY